MTLDEKLKEIEERLNYLFDEDPTRVAVNNVLAALRKAVEQRGAAWGNVGDYA